MSLHYLYKTLVRWIKTTFQLAGTNMSTFTPHSTRSASTSRAATRIPIDTVLKTDVGGGALEHL